MFFWDRPLLFLFSTCLLHLLFAFQHPYSLFLKIWSPLSLVTNNSLVENFELVISNDDNNSSKESKVSNNDDTACKSAQNSPPWVLPDKYITDWLRKSINLEFAYSPYSSRPWISHCLKNVMFCFHWWLTIHQWTEFQYPIPLMSKFPVLSISLFSAESGQTSYRKVPCFTNKVLEWYKHLFQFSLILCIHLMTRSELQFS